MEEKITLLVDALGEREDYPSGIFDNSIACSEAILKDYFKADIPTDLVVFSKIFGAFSFKNIIMAKSIDKNSAANEHGAVSVNYFVSITGINNTIMHLTVDYKDIISKKFLPFCEGTSGDLIGVSLRKRDFGKIYYWFHESEVGKEYILMANSFYEFLQNLFVEEVSDNSPVESKEIEEKVLTGLSPAFVELLKKSGIIK